MRDRVAVGPLTPRRTFVAVFHPYAGEVVMRATCTRCSPRWFGPEHSFSAVAASASIRNGLAARDLVADRALRDVLAHLDRAHNGQP